MKTAAEDIYGKSGVVKIDDLRRYAEGVPGLVEAIAHDIGIETEEVIELTQLGMLRYEDLQKVVGGDNPFVEDESKKMSPEDALLAGQIVEDALKTSEAEHRRRMRPIEDAAKLDPTDPGYHEKLMVLVEEVKSNLAADEKPTIDERWRAKRLAKTKEH